jgi:hypothetical protein
MPAGLKALLKILLNLTGRQLSLALQALWPLS